MPLRFSQFATTTLLACLAFALGACRKSNRETPNQTGRSGKDEAISVVIAPELMSNQIGSLPGVVYQSQANSPIRWQPWIKETLERAKAANRLVMAVVAMPQYHGLEPVISQLIKDPVTIEAIHQKYVPVLIDGEAARELGLLAVDLYSETKNPIRFPLFMWMTADACPVAWTAITDTPSSDAVELFRQSDSTISKMWQDDRNYVISNSIKDNDNRYERLALRKNTEVMSQKPGQEALASLRQLASFYDPISRSFDESGGLFPSGALELMSTMAVHPGVSEEVRARCLQMTRELMKDLVYGPMFDPLDGGAFSLRFGKSWSFPVFNRDCNSQARIAIAMLNCYRATKDESALDRAIGVISFAEKNFQTPDGLFAIGKASSQEPEKWFWKIEDIQKALGPKDAAWWIKATNMSAAGNLPPETDPSREFRNFNSIGLTKSLSEIAASESQSLAEFTPRFEATRQKLFDMRNNRIQENARDTNAYANSSFLWFLPTPLHLM
ncbi:MAG: DUF255 domain-containing protein [Akkermansiaceae bacterium]|nr:DUF255 domain-containing protein [Akkermansiaceae bacterium]